MKDFLIADTHFHHKNILCMEQRPFKDLLEMEEKMIEAWNTVVSPEDTVRILGDFSLGSYSRQSALLERLNGIKFLIKGNHDITKVVDRLLETGHFKEVHSVGETIRHDKTNVMLTHYPMQMGERLRLINIHGHIHSQDSSEITQINVGVDSTFMHVHNLMHNKPYGTPILWDDLIPYIDERLKQVEDKYQFYNL